MPIPGFQPYVDFAPFGQLTQAYAVGEEQRAKREQGAREDAARAEFMRTGIPKGPGGEPDFGKAVDTMFRYGNIAGVPELASMQNAQAQRRTADATLAETRRYHDIVSEAYNKPQIVKGEIDPLHPEKQPMWVVTSDKHGNVTAKPFEAPGVPGQPAAPAGNPLLQPEPVDRPQLPPMFSPNTMGRQPLPAGMGVPQPPPATSGAGPGPSVPPQAPPQMPPGPPAVPDETMGGGPVPPAPPPQAAPQAPPGGLPPGFQMPPPMPVPPGAGLAPPIMPAPPPAAAPPAAPEPAAAPQLRFTTPLGPFNEAALEGLPAGLQNKIRASARGEFNPATLSRQKGYQQAFTDKVYEYYPGWDNTLYGRRQKTLNAFAVGPEGRTVRAVNNLTDHLETATELVKALKNGQVPAINAAINKWRQVSGYDAELPGNIKAAAPIIAGEMVKVIAGASGGGVGERMDAALNTLSTSANPQAAMGALNTVKQLMVGQMHGLEQQYENNTYKTDFRERLSKGARRVLEDTEKPHAGGGALGDAPRTTNNVPYTIIGR